MIRLGRNRYGLAAALTACVILLLAAACSQSEPPRDDGLTYISDGSALDAASDADARPPTMTGVTITSSSDFVVEGVSLTFCAEAEYDRQPQGGQTDIVWTSSDEAVALVDEKGTVTGVAPGRALITARSADGMVRDSRVLRVARSGLVFLSPSRQTWNDYAVGGTNECVEAFNIAYMVEERLLAVGCEVYVCPVGPDLIRRAKIADEKDSLCYVAIHTNAGAANYFGTTALFHPRVKGALALALSVYDEVAELTPTAEKHGLTNGMAKNGVGYAEIREPGEWDIPSTLLEIEYHDKPEQAQWIIDHEPEIADAITVGILKYLSQ